MRKHYIDNARYFAIFLVLFCHLTDPTFEYIYTSDVPDLYKITAGTFFIEPWFMLLFFAISGVCMRYVVERHPPEDRRIKPLVVSRLKGIVLPAVSYMVLLGWIPYVTFAVLTAPGAYPALSLETFRLYLALFTGPMWFCFELFGFSVILALLVKLDKKDLLHGVGEKLWVYPLLLIPLLVLPMSSVNPDESILYNFAYFLIGYVFFSHEKTVELLRKYWFVLVVPGFALGVYVMIKNFGIASTYYAERADVDLKIAYATGIVERIYSWLMVPAMLALFIRFFDKENAFTRYMKTHAFPFFILQYPLQYVGAYIAVTLLRLPDGYPRYGAILLFIAVSMPLLTFVIRRIPGLRYVLFREKGPEKKEKKQGAT